MSSLAAGLAFVAVLASASAATPPTPAATTPPAQVAPALTADECSVWRRELSFAASVAAHDAAAFAGHVAPDAVFGVNGPRVQRGRDAVVAGWARIVRGEGMRLEWYPQHVTAVGDLAWSTGPALVEQLDGRAPRFLLSSYQSVWRRNSDGTWHVLFDGGTAPREATEAQAAAFRAAHPAGCPAATPPH
ncbi:YybH family protein [Lysobacter humi (ex Lee et al. 2017)]